jgi:hypothetical protein
MTQQEQLHKRLRTGWTTGLDALKYCGCMRLAARVLEMRQAGLTVIDKWVEINGKRFKAYKII